MVHPARYLTRFVIYAFVTMPVVAQAQMSLKYAVIDSRHGVRSPTQTNEQLSQYAAEPWPDWGVAPGELSAHGRDLMKLFGGL